MVKPSLRTQKKKFRRAPSGTRKYYVDGKNSKHTCALTGAQLHGVPHGTAKAAVSRLAKSQRRPTRPFAGVLSGKAMERVFVQAALVKYGFKSEDAVDISLRKYVKMAQGKVE